MGKKSYATLKAKQDKASRIRRLLQTYGHRYRPYITGHMSLDFAEFEKLDRVDQLDQLNDWIEILRVYRDAVRIRYHREGA